MAVDVCKCASCMQAFNCYHQSAPMAVRDWVLQDILVSYSGIVLTCTLTHITNWTPGLTHHKLDTTAHTPQTAHLGSHTTNWTPVLTHHKLDTSADTPQTGHLEAW
eukprot:scpid92324/ scgid2338/ 